MEVTNKERVESVAEAKRDNKRFITTVFSVAIFLSLVVAFLYWQYSPSGDKSFHLIVIVAAGGITIPMFISTMRLMLKGYYLSLEGWQATSRMMEGYEKLQQKAEPIADRISQVVADAEPIVGRVADVAKKVDPIVGKVEEISEKAVPIAVSIEEVVVRAKGMANDVEAIAHKVRGTMDQLNGNLDLKSLEGKLDKLADSIATIASVFKPLSKKSKKGTPFAPPVPGLEAVAATVEPEPEKKD